MADLGELRLDSDPAGTWRLRPVTDADQQFLYALHRAAMSPAAMGPYITAIFGWDEAAQQGFQDRWFDQLQQPDGAGRRDLDHRGRRRGRGRGAGVRRGRSPVPVAGGGAASLAGSRGGQQRDRALQTLATRQGRPVRLHVFEINPARRLYARLGFHVVEQAEGHCRQPFDGWPASRHHPPWPRP
jgi:hypothetical protein